MRFDAKNRFLLDFLILATLLLSCSLLVTSEETQKLFHARDARKLSGAITIKLRRGRSLEPRHDESPPPGPKAPQGQARKRHSPNSYIRYTSWTSLALA